MTKGTVLITGASSGIGRAAAFHFHAKGWHVFATVRKPEDGAALETEARDVGSFLSAPGVLQAVVLDVSGAHGHTDAQQRVRGFAEHSGTAQDCVRAFFIADEASVQAAVPVVAAACGPQGLNVLINNAGIAVFGPLETTPLDSWRRVFETNVYGVATVTRHFLPLLRQAATAAPSSSSSSSTQGARIINIGSAAGKVSAPLQTVYTSSKHALEGLTDCLRAELAPQHIQVVLMQLGVVATAMAGKIRAASAVSTQAALALGQASGTATQGLGRRAEQQVAVGGGGGGGGGGSGADNVAQIYESQVKESLELFDSLESTSIPISVVLKALDKAATVRRPSTRYAVDGQIAMSLWLRWAMTDRMWDWFYPKAAQIAKAKADKKGKSDRG